MYYTSESYAMTDLNKNLYSLPAIFFDECLLKVMQLNLQFFLDRL